MKKEIAFSFAQKHDKRLERTNSWKSERQHTKEWRRRREKKTQQTHTHTTEKNSASADKKMQKKMQKWITKLAHIIMLALSTPAHLPINGSSAIWDICKHFYAFMPFKLWLAFSLFFCSNFLGLFLLKSFKLIYRNNPNKRLQLHLRSASVSVCVNKHIIFYFWLFID